MFKREIIYTEKHLKEALDKVKEKGIFSFDFETAPLPRFEHEQYAALDPHKAFISTMSFAYSEDIGYTIPISHYVGKNINMSIETLSEKLNEIFKDNSILKIAFNGIFESKFCIKMGWLLSNLVDPMHLSIRALQLLNPKELDPYSIAKGMGLKAQSDKYLGYQMDTFENTLHGAVSFAHINIEDGAKYSIDDAVISLILFNLWKEKLLRIKRKQGRKCEQSALEPLRI